MDSSRFDDIIKNKLEDHVDPSGPSAAEMSRMLDSMPQTPGGLSGVSTATKIATAASLIFMITTIFLIYRTYLLNDTLTSVQHELINLGKQNQEILYKYDTLYWDSLQHYTRQAIRDQYRQQPIPVANQQQAGFQLAAADSERLVSQLLKDLQKAIEEDPEFRATILSQLDLSEAELGSSLTSVANTEEALIPEEDEGVVMAEVTQPTKTDLTAVLLDLASEEEHAKKLTNILMGMDADTPEEDQLTMPASKVLKAELMAMSEEEQADMIKDFSRSAPEVTNASIRSLGLDSVFEQTLDRNEFLLSALTDEKDTLQVANSTADEMPPVIRNEKKPVAWWLNVGGGAGLVSINSAGNPSTTIFHAGVERRIGDHIGILAGAVYQSTEGESYDVENFDFSVFDAFEAEDIKEIKTYLTWMDIPIEARFYVLPGRKVNPFVGVSLKVRSLLRERYLVETNSGGEITPSFTNDNSAISFPVFGAGAGAQFYLNQRLFGEVKVNQSFGGSKLDLLGDRLNSLQAQGSLFIRLSK